MTHSTSGVAPSRRLTIIPLSVCAMLLGAVGCNIDVIGEPRVARIGGTWTFSAAGFQDSYGEPWTKART